MWKGKSNSVSDHRGHFNRLFCSRELKEILPADHREIVNINSSFNLLEGTLRGIHLQTGNAAETKIVFCSSGSIIDVAVDLRPDSPTFLQHESSLLEGESSSFMVIPPGCGHAFQSLEPNSLVIYFVTRFYSPTSELSIYPFDKSINISWPITDAIISRKDSSAPCALSAKIWLSKHSTYD